MTKRVAFSAPGKALLAGGYLVLLPQYSAYVVALSARIHAVVSEDNNNNSGSTTITIKSPQFNHGEWVYTVSADSQYQPVLVSDYGNNPFVEAVIRTVVGYSFAYESNNLQKSVLITIYSDDAYHSQIFRDVKVNGHAGTPFHYHSRSIREVPKTGLGSSAALTTSLTAALFSFYLPHLRPVENLDKIHNLAQLAHCSAQKKVGSGFDIASAVYGSLKYSRFPVETIPNELFSNESSSLISFSKSIRSIIDSNWKMTHSSCSLPPGLGLLMGDVKNGSETPKMASMVLEWRKLNPDRANEIWNSIDSSNTNLVRTLNELNKLSIESPQSYNELLKSGITNTKSLLYQLRENFLEIRKYLRIMTVESKAQIEPDQQTLLLDKCNEIPGVIGGVVPGAGGFDAISLLIVKDSLSDIKEYTRQSRDSIFSDLTWLDLSEETIGLREESVEMY